VGDVGEGVRAADAWDQGEMGDPVLVAECGGEREREAGRHGSNRI
jgi:hypothetical protein